MTDTNKLNWPRWAQALLIALLAVLIANRLFLLIDTASVRAGLYGEVPEYGGLLADNPGGQSGFVKARQVEPGGPLAKAGVQEGDALRFEHSYEPLRRAEVGETLPFTLDHGGVRSNRQLTIEPTIWNEANKQQNFQLLLNLLAATVSLLIACFILWRGWGNKTAMLLGAALIPLGTGGYLLPPWASAPVLAIPMWSLVLLANALSSLLIPFAMRMVEENVGPLPRWHWRAANVYLALTIPLWAVVGWNVFSSANFGGMLFRGGPVPLIAPLVSVAYLIVGWRKSEAAVRNRFALILFALLAYLVGRLVIAWNLSQSGTLFGGSGWLTYLNTLTVGVIAPATLAYAVLRHKLFDLGFAVNRTLVYGTVSAVLLVGIGLTEYAVKSLLPKVWTQGSVFISAGLALGVFLIFHRIHHSVEHFIERLFFHKWQVNEAALKRFVAAAAHVEKPEALAGNYVAELARFTGGATAALYTRTAEGHYASASGDTIDADDPALAAMRAEQSHIVPAEVHSSLPAALALPMMHQAALAGFVLLGPKPTAEDYRPDEIEILGWATQQVGLDMQAIRVHDLEQAVITLEARNQNLSEVLERAASGSAVTRPAAHVLR
jgi:hypothetical protein